MYALDAPRSLISYKDLWASDIHISTALDRDEEVLELQQGQRLLATANAGDEGLYRIVIEAITKSPISLTDANEICMAAWAKGPKQNGRNMATNVSKDITAKPNMWHRRLGHPDVMVFRRMLPLTMGHNLTHQMFTNK